MTITCDVYITFQWQVNDDLICTLEIICMLFINYIIVVKDSYLDLKYEHQIIFQHYCNDVISTLMCKQQIIFAN